MGKLRFDINSTDVLGTYGIVNIEFNGTVLAATKQLSATVESLEYDVSILTSSNNVLKISLLNDQAHDTNNDGIFTDADELLKVKVTNLEYSIDNINFVTLLPQVGDTYTVPTGPYAGNIAVLKENVTEFISFSPDYALTFNSDGIVNTVYCSGLKGKLLPNGNYQDLVNGKIFDINGNEV